MSLFVKSATREFGKSAGRTAGNIVFGKKNAILHRRVGSVNTSSSRMASELKQSKEAEYQRLLRDKLLSIDAAVLKNVDSIASIQIPNDKENLLHLLSELSTQVKANKWHKNDEEGKIRNKYTEALFEKYYQCVLKLQSIAPFDSQTDYFENIADDYKQKRIEIKYGWIINTGLFFIAFIITFLFDGILYNILPGFVIILALSSIIIFTAYYVLKKFMKHKKRKEKKNRKLAYLQTDSKVDNVLLNSNDTVISNQIIENTFFIDLNDNYRIENSLSLIWNKYKNKVDTEIINRKPIFSADGIKDSILFVGINPSYNFNDDKLLIKSNDNTALIYGSFYQLPDAPDYFKELEFFASKFNKSYTQINLLYARENDREFLMKTDQGFIREQLELTYETILKINPIAIVFFSDYCKDLIFGKDRWIDPNSESNGCYTLNGTKYPVFFSNDITMMTVKEQIELINKVQKSISK